MGTSVEPTGEPADILLVEDNPGDVRLTEEALDEGKVDVNLSVVRDGEEALEFLHRRGDHADAPRPDIVLLDLNLPGKNGEDVLEEINDDEVLSRIPVIVLTSSAAEEDIVRTYDLRANAYLTKPIDPDEFVAAVRAFEAFWLRIVHLPPEA